MISEATVELVRTRTDLVKYLSETVRLERRGRSWKGCCPFHKERSPSFHVRPDRGTYHCFGCGEHGDAFSFAMKVDGMTFREAVVMLAERAGVAVEETGTEQDRREEEAKRKAKTDLYDAVRLAQVFFQTQLEEHPHAHLARAEFAKRIPEHTDLAARVLASFGAGYAPSGWDGLATFLRSQGVSPAVAEQAGLLVPRKNGPGYYDRFRHRLMLSVMDLQGRPIAFSGRVLPDPETGAVDKETGKYVNSPESSIYRKSEILFGLFQARQAIRQEDEAVVVEGNFDVVSLAARGIGNVVAPLGTAFTVEQAKLLKRFTPNAVLFFDGDAAGKKAILGARDTCLEAGLSARVASSPQGKDPDEFVRMAGPDAVKAAVRRSIGLVERMIEAELERAMSSDVRAKAESLRAVVAILEGEPDPVARAIAARWAEEAAKRLGLFGTELGAYPSLRGMLRSQPASAPAPAHDASLEAVLGAMADLPVVASRTDIAPLLEVLPEEALALVADLSAGAIDVARLTTPLGLFVRGRLHAPAHTDEATAYLEAFTNLRKMQERAEARHRQAFPMSADDARALSALARK